MREKRGMKRWFLFGVLVLSLAGLVGCGGGGDEAAPLFTGTFSKMAVVAGAEDNVAIFDNVDASSRIQVLVKAGDIDGAGFVKSMTFKFAGAASTGSTIQNLTIKMGHTVLLTNDNLTATFASNVVNGKGSQVTVFGPATLTVPTGAVGSSFTIPLSGNFNYNGVDDLVIEFTMGKVSKPVTVAGHLASNFPVLYADNSVKTTGDLYQNMADVKLTFAGGVDTIPVTVVDGNRFPFTPGAGWGTKVQLLYSSKEIDGSGPITGIGFQVYLAPTADNSFNYTIRMAHNKLGALTTKFDNNFNAGAPVVVADNLTFKYNGALAQGDWFWVPLTTPFYYNGTDNLLVEMKCFNADGNLYVGTGIGPPDTRLYGALDCTAGLGLLNDFKYLVKFRFGGGTVDVIPGSPFNEDTQPFSTDNNMGQYLYRAPELGSKVTIQKIAFRLSSDAVAGSYPSFQLKMSLTDNVAFGNSFAGNLPAAQTVFSGTVTIPATLKQGDWIEIPLSASFQYTPTKNLVVQHFAPAGTADINVDASGSSTRFYRRHAFKWDPIGDVPDGVNSYLRDMKLTVQ